MSRNVPANGPAVQKMLELDPTGLQECCGSIETSPVEFELVQSGGELDQKDVQTCVNLIESTSGGHYRASSIGWSEAKKKKEMKDAEMMYLLLRQGAGSSKRKRASDVTLCSSKQIKAAQDHSVTPHRQFNETCYNVTGDQESDKAKTSNSQAPCDLHPVRGFISFMFTYDDPPHQDRQVVYIYEIHLDAQLRGVKLGSKLIAFVEHAARDRGITKTMLTVFKSNKGARALYERLGYSKDACSPQDRIVRKRVIEADYIIMSKELSSQE